MNRQTKLHGSLTYSGRELARLLALSLVLLSTIVWALPVPTYAELQAYKGRAYFKDESIWIYTKEFAATFRMPSQWVSERMHGAEAIAFRIQPAELDCGLAGRADACRRNDRCITDVYIDEDKYPLPWSTDQSADWLPLTDSSRWLYRMTDGIPGRPPLPSGVQRPAVHSLMPWVDLQAKVVAMYYEDSAYKEDHGRTTQLIGFKRHLVGSLTMLSFHYRCLSRTRKPYTSFRLELRKDGSGSPVLKRYHEFRIPESLEAQIDQLLDIQRHKDEADFKRFLNTR